MIRLKNSTKYTLFLLVTCMMTVFILITSDISSVKSKIFNSGAKYDVIINQFNDKDYPNLAKFYVSDIKHPKEFNKTCATFPKLFDLYYNNFYWQNLFTSNGTYHLLNAYLDDRNTNWTIRISGMLNRIAPELEIFCQIWYQDYKVPVIVQVI